MDINTYFVIAAAITLSISTFFQIIINVEASQQPQQITIINPSPTPQSSSIDRWLVAFMILIGVSGVLYLVLNG